MAYEFSTLRGSTYLRLGGSATTTVLKVLDALDVIDHETGPPKPPKAVLVHDECNPDWALDDELPPTVIAYYSSGSPRAARVPAYKLRDNSVWIVTQAEARTIADALDRTLAQGVERRPELARSRSGRELPDDITRDWETRARHARGTSS